jgi:hypothetical protein
MVSFLGKERIAMRRFARRLAVFMSAGILLATRVFLSAADDPRPCLSPRDGGEYECVAEQAKSKKEIQRLIDQLGNERFKDRERATQKLSKLGKPALPSLKEATKSPDPEVRRRAQQLVERIESRPAQPIDPQFAPRMPALKTYV